MDKIKAIVSKILSNFKVYAILGAIVLLALFSFKGCRKIEKKQDSDVKNTVLTPDQKEKVIVDPVHHKITVVTKNPDGSSTSKDTYLPDRPSEVVEDNKGNITVVTHKFGAELRPYLGVGGAFDGTPRVHVGADVFYFHQMDLGLGIDDNPAHLKDVRANLNLSYNFYSNTSVAVSYDNHKTVGLFLKVRF